MDLQEIDIKVEVWLHRKQEEMFLFWKRGDGKSKAMKIQLQYLKIHNFRFGTQGTNNRPRYFNLNSGMLLLKHTFGALR